MARSATTKEAQALLRSLRTAYAATPNHLKIIDVYIMFAIFTAVIQQGHERRVQTEQSEEQRQRAEPLKFYVRRKWRQSG